MTEIHWAERYRTGIPFIDAQHQELFRAVARIQSALGNLEDHWTLQEELAELLALLKTHFHDEEEFLRRKAYPDLLSHASEHIALLQDLQKILDRFEGEPASGAAMVSTFVTGWLRHHISEGDFRYADFLRTTGDGVPDPVVPEGRDG